MRWHRHTHTHISTQHDITLNHGMQGPAYMPAWGQPQPSPWTGSSDGDVSMTLALYGPSGAALAPAAREAVQHAVAQAIPGIGEPIATAIQCSTSCCGAVILEHVRQRNLWAADSSSTVHTLLSTPCSETCYW